MILEPQMHKMFAMAQRALSQVEELLVLGSPYRNGNMDDPALMVVIKDVDQGELQARLERLALARRMLDGALVLLEERDARTELIVAELMMLLGGEAADRAPGGDGEEHPGAAAVCGEKRQHPHTTSTMQQDD